MPEVSKCSMQGCGAAIIWTVSPSGARLCVDARPVTVYELEDDTGQTHALDLKHQIDDLWPGIKDAKLYISHWLTCKNPPERR